MYIQEQHQSQSEDCANLKEFKYDVDGQTIIKNSRYMKNI